MKGKLKTQPPPADLTSIPRWRVEWFYFVKNRTGDYRYPPSVAPVVEFGSPADGLT